MPYTHELTGYKKDSARSLEEYRLRKHMASWKAAVIVFVAMPIYMLLNLSKGKQMTILAAISMVAITLSPVHFV